MVVSNPNPTLTPTLPLALTPNPNPNPNPTNPYSNSNPNPNPNPNPTLRILTLKCEAERLFAEAQPCQNKRRSSSQDVPEDIPAFSEPSYFDPLLVRSAAGFGMPVFSEQPEIKKKQRKGDFRSSRTHLTFSGASTGNPPSKSAASTRTYLSFSGSTPVQQTFDQDMC